MAATDVLPRLQHSSAGTTANSDSLESLLMQNATCIPRLPTPILKCCCGQADCAFLRHNERQLDGLERDVQTAAQMGQALLIRHENYMADAERERLSMTAMIEKLETDKRSLEAENAKTIEENRGLLNQLEELNNSVTETDDHVKSLTATLLSTQEELQRLTALAARTEQLEQQLALLEEEQAQLQQTLITTQEEERSAVQRWKRAERMLADLQDQIERIEREAREERERHVEVVGRLERRRVVERELDSAAGRLKGAAAATTLGKGKGGSNVVSHFVKDILQDNANLQIGIVELREMLMVSNEEVQNLREQLAIHQPVTEEGQLSATLRKELGQDSLPSVPQLPQELHVHHHYHAPPVIPEPPMKDKPLPHRRPKKKRHVLTPALFAPPSMHSRAPSYSMLSPTTPSTASAILSQTSVSIPPIPSTPPLPPQYASKRSSVQSTQTRASSFAPSSVPSSPPSIFDRGFGWNNGGLDSSRPTSPDSSVGVGGGLYSPVFAPVGRGGFMRGSDTGYRCFSSPTVGACGPTVSGSVPGLGLHPTWEENDADADVEETDHSEPAPDHETPQDRQHEDYDDSESADQFSPNPNRHGLRRTTSHDSILSINALDLAPTTSRSRHNKHSKLSRPSLLTLRSPSPAVADIAVLTSLTATARPVSRRGEYDSRTFTRGLLGSLQPPQEEEATAPTPTQPPKAGAIGTVGGWVWSRWGVSPLKTVKTEKSVEEEAERPPGVNQPGFIRGFLAAAERKEREEERERLRKRKEERERGVRPEVVDEEGLKEALGE